MDIELDKEFLDRITETSGCIFEEYKYVYPRLMDEYVQQYCDNTELTFIEREIENHSIIMGSHKNEMIKISDFDYRRKHFDPIEENFGQKKFLEMMLYYEKRVSSHKAIINYLETKKTELAYPESVNTDREHFINPKKEKISEKYHALHYWLESTAHGNELPIDVFGNFIRRDLEAIGAKRCNSTGQGFYRAFKEIDLNNPYNLKRDFGNNWKNIILKLSEKDNITTSYINENYK